MDKGQSITDKAIAMAEKVSNNKYLSAISNGLMGTLPVLIVGSISLLLASLPIKPWLSFLNWLGLTSYLGSAYQVTVGCLAVYASFMISYQLAKNFDTDAIPAGMLGLFSFLVLTPFITLKKTTTLDISKLGAQGLFTAMISSLVFVSIYVFIAKKNIGIKMPDGVPPFVSKTFAGLVPFSVAGALAIIVASLFGKTSWGSFSDFIYAILATPLQHLSSSVWSLLFLILVQMIFWFFGIHGSLLISSFITALYLPMDVANMDALQNGVANSHLPNIIGYTFYNIFSGIGGAGGTLSLLIVILLMAKAKQLRAIGNLSIIPGLFTINEPVIFGLPMILNPLTVVPFVLTPLVQTLLAYWAIALGLVPHLNGIQVPFGTPVFINAFIAGGWRASILQVVLIAVGCVIYFPFVKALDSKDLKDEKAAAAKKESDSTAQQADKSGLTAE